MSWGHCRDAICGQISELSQYFMVVTQLQKSDSATRKDLDNPITGVDTYKYVSRGPAGP